MKRKRKNSEPVFIGWLWVKMTSYIREAYDKQKQITIRGWEAANVTERAQACSHLWFMLTAVFTVLWACCGLTFSGLIGFSNWYPTAFYCCGYLFICVWLAYIFVRWLYSSYADDLDNIESEDNS